MATLKDDYPTIINGVTYQPFKKWDVTYNDNVVTHETEGGIQEDTSTRRGRRSISVATTCLEALASQLVLLEDEDEFIVKYYDLKTRGYVESTMRVAPGSMSHSLKEKTARLSSTLGVYSVSFTLEEF